MRNGTDVAAGIVERFRRYGWSTPEGEWGAINAETRSELHGILSAGDPRALASYLNKMFQTPLYYGLVSMSDSVDDVLQQVLWRLALWTYFTPERNDEVLAAPKVGSPFVVDVNGVPIAIDTPRFDLYAQRIAALSPGTVLELGGGYGGVALQASRRCDAQWVLCDIPETLYLAWYWLSYAADRHIAWWDEDPGADIVLLPQTELEASGCRPDVVFAAHTLSGLPAPEIARYMAWLDKSGARYFYHDDATEDSGPGVWMADRFKETLLADFHVPDSYELVRSDRIPWAGPCDRFQEALYAKR
jgi:hypothetical protein